MASVLDVANYFLVRTYNETGQLMTQIKLYKLVYYAQAWSLVFRGKRLFAGEIQAWSHGPVPVDLRPIFQDLKDEPIPPSRISSVKAVFEEADIKVLDAVFVRYSPLTPWRLRDLTHQEMPWIKARNGLPKDTRCSNPISECDMSDYYSSFINPDCSGFDIPAIATSIEKDDYISFNGQSEISGSIDELVSDDLPAEFLEKVKSVSAEIQKSKRKYNYPDGLAAYLAGYTD